MLSSFSISANSILRLGYSVLVGYLAIALSNSTCRCSRINLLARLYHLGTITISQCNVLVNSVTSGTLITLLKYTGPDA